MITKIKKGVINNNAPKSYRGKAVTYEDKLLDGVSVHSLCGTSELIVKHNPEAKLYLTREFFFRTPKDPSACYPVIPANWIDSAEE